EMSEGNQMILREVAALQEFTRAMNGSMEEMSIGAEKINETASTLTTIAADVKDSIDQIGGQIDQFRV
ncbi:MAG: methyl-accepting chemotaxis protein, partial [Treponema sp.]|nr:methyl-accepting chemotaxis protein [Treponema sp.]